jgi:hypothetical protein
MADARLVCVSGWNKQSANSAVHYDPRSVRGTLIITNPAT